MPTGNVATPFGRGAMTLGMLATQVAASRITPNKSIDKWKIYRAVCEARCRLGVTDRALAILNALLSFLPKAELSAEGGLVVFPSNNQLSLRANGMAEATLRRHLAVLIKAGLLARKDSANGKRYARRREGCGIDDAYGFSLAPLLARSEEILRLAAEVAMDRLHQRHLRERLTICRRDLAKMIATAVEEGAPGDWVRIYGDFRNLVAAMPRRPTPEVVAATLSAMEQLRADVVNQLQTWLNAKIPVGNDLQADRHIQSSESQFLSELEAGSEPRCEDGSTSRDTSKAPKGGSLPLAMVLQGCPEIGIYGPGGRVATWRDLTVAAVTVRSMLGVSPSAYHGAIGALGPANAAVAMACILERAGQINSAGGYLRDLTRRAERGAFSLQPMLMALLRSRRRSGAGPAPQEARPRLCSLSKPGADAAAGSEPQDLKRSCPGGPQKRSGMARVQGRADEGVGDDVFTRYDRADPTPPSAADTQPVRGRRPW